MKFAVKAWSNGRARAGVLQLGGCPNPVEIETPALLVATRKGLPNFISPDLLPSLPSPDSNLLQFSPLHFMEGVSMKTISKIGGLHQMVGLKEHIFVAVPRDSILSLPEYQSTNKMGASFETPCGRILIKPAEYVEMISSMKPNIWMTLADEVPAWVSDKRNRTSVERTLRWLDACLESNMVASAGGAIFGSIVGGSRVEERQHCAQEVAKRDVSGYWIGGFGLGESMEERTALLTAVTDNLPEERPRQICGVGLPEEVLQAVAAGIDLFDSTYASNSEAFFTFLSTFIYLQGTTKKLELYNRYIYHLTLGGFALIFPLDTSGRQSSDNLLTDAGGDGTKINLKATIFRKDTSPIVDGCKCYTCQNHTKAYINHLFNVHEMLSQILLEIHNTHHYLGFFRSIRETIKEGKFEKFRQNFIGSRREHITAAAASA